MSIIKPLKELLMFFVTSNPQALTKSEYFTRFPERVTNGDASCECGSSNIHTICAPINSGPIHKVCSVCKTTLFTTNIYDK